MTIILCDICGVALEKGTAEVTIRISEYKADACEKCAKELIKHVKTGYNKNAQSN